MSCEYCGIADAVPPVPPWEELHSSHCPRFPFPALRVEETRGAALPPGEFTRGGWNLFAFGGRGLVWRIAPKEMSNDV